MYSVLVHYVYYYVLRVLLGYYQNETKTVCIQNSRYYF